MARKLILDCDPGIDDALAIMLTLGSDELELLGITTVAGNISVAQTTINAQRVCAAAGVPDVVVAAGCETPLIAHSISGAHIHGESGLGRVRWPVLDGHLHDQHAIDFLISTVLDHAPGEVAIVATGPLTNVALALRREPRLAGRVAEVVLMAGSTTRGNITPAAEFNAFADPEAAAIVFAAGWPITMIGLNLTHQALASKDVFQRLHDLQTPLGDCALDLLEFVAETNAHTHGLTSPPVHDPCAVAALAYPELIELQDASVAVELCGSLTRGMTVCDLRPSPERVNARVGVSLDRDGFWDALIGAIATLSGPALLP
jgi:purine nucleosidase